MAEEPKNHLILSIPLKWRERILFYVTGFFLLLCIFSAFAFLFLVPFIIEPAYSTLHMDFDAVPAQCVTAFTVSKRGLSNCSWTSCREGCTREVYECTQILVNYRHADIPDSYVLRNTRVVLEESQDENDDVEDVIELGGEEERAQQIEEDNTAAVYDENDTKVSNVIGKSGTAVISSDNGNVTTAYEDENRKFKWFYGARLFPNVKGCGYPPYLNCTLFNEKYSSVDAAAVASVETGSINNRTYSCYFSRADPSIVISELNTNKVYLHLICASVVPIALFLLSLSYLVFAYFYIYNDRTAAKGAHCNTGNKAINPTAAANKNVIPASEKSAKKKATTTNANQKCAATTSTIINKDDVFEKMCDGDESSLVVGESDSLVGEPSNKKARSTSCATTTPAAPSITETTTMQMLPSSSGFSGILTSTPTTTSDICKDDLSDSLTYAKKYAISDDDLLIGEDGVDDSSIFSTSHSSNDGNSMKMMTMSISTPPGPIAQL